jgi:hypothetical protein
MCSLRAKLPLCAKYTAPSDRGNDLLGGEGDSVQPPPRDESYPTLVRVGSGTSSG